ncbi:MAG: hypothetical protein ABI832_07245 [bacterium]
MANHRNLLGVSLLALALASPVVAQTADTTAGATATGTVDTTTGTATGTADTTATGTAGTTATGTADTTATGTADTTTTGTAGTATVDTTLPATTTAPADGTTAMDCAAQFKTLDADGNGHLSESEAAQVYAQARITDTTIAADGYSQDDFIAACNDNSYARAVPEAGAPFTGANSFTEGQAKDRAIAWGVTDVSDLTKDDNGIWRGTGMVDGASVAVAVDFKGNVVTSSQ